MTSLILLAIAVLFGSMSLYFAWRFILSDGKRLPSLVCALLPIGWVLVAARELKLFPRWSTTPLLALALCVGIVGVLIIVNFESQQPKPFR